MDLSHPHPPSIATDFLSPHLNNMVYPSMSRHYPPDALATNPYFSPAVAGNFEYLVQAQREADLKLFIQHGDVELLTPNQNKFIKKLQDEGVQVDLDVVEGGAHLDPGIAFALLERKSESSWVRLLDAVRRYTMRQLPA
jgi:acetyl esterase/lipase